MCINIVKRSLAGRFQGEAAELTNFISRRQSQQRESKPHLAGRRAALNADVHTRQKAGKTPERALDDPQVHQNVVSTGKVFPVTPCEKVIPPDLTLSFSGGNYAVGPRRPKISDA